MAGFPIEEALVAPVLATAAALVIPRASRALARRFLPTEARSAANVGATIGALSAVVALGVDSLGPALVDARHWSWVLVAALVLLVIAHGVQSWGARDERARPSPSIDGPAMEGNTKRGGSIPLSAILVTSALGIAVALGAIAARRVVVHADPWWSIRLAPWRAEAYLEAGWSLASESPERAEALMTIGERAGVRASDATRLRSELAAVAGDCDRARTLYEQAIVEHARESLEAWERLELGALPVPEQLALRCGLGEDAVPTRAD